MSGRLFCLPSPESHLAIILCRMVIKVKKNINRGIFLPFFLLCLIGLQHSVLSGQERSKDPISSRKDSLKVPLDSKEKIRIHNWLAYNYLFSDLDSAEHYSNLARVLARKENLKREMVISLHNLALHSYYKGNFATGFEYASHAVDLADSLADRELQAGAYSDIGMIEAERGNYKSSLKSFIRVLEIHQSQEDTFSIASTLLNIGLVWENLKEFDKALTNYQKAFNYARIVKDTMIQLYAYNNIGVAHENITKEIDSALYYYLLASDLAQQFSRENHYTQAILLHNIGDIYLRMDKIEEAEEYLTRSLAISRAKKLGGVELASVETLSRLEMKRKNYANAIEIAREGYQMAKQQEFVSVIPNLLKTLATSFKQQDEKDSSYHYLLLYSENMEETQKKREDEEVKKLALAVDLAKKEQELSYQKQRLDEEARQTKRLYLLLAVALVAVLALTYLGIQLNQSKTTVDQVNAQIEHQNQELANLNHVKDRIFSLIAHDIRAPLGNMRGLMEILLESNIDGQDRKRLAEQLRQQMAETDSIFENLLLWSSAHKKGINPQNISFSKIVKDCLESSESMAEKKKIHIELKEEFVGMVYSDQLLTQSVLRNFLTNAIKFSGEGTRIVVRTWKDGNFQWVSVMDFGVGISPDRLGCIFDVKKNRSTPGTMGEKGTGLGMPLCREFVELNGGEIRVESELGKGSTFSFSLPLAMEGTE